MKNKRLNRRILLNEIIKAYGKMGTYLLYCMIPAAFVLLFSVLMERAQQIGQCYRIGVYSEWEQVSDRLERVIEESANAFLSQTPFSKDEILKNGVTVAIRIDQSITIIYSEELVSNPGALYEAQSLARRFSAILADETSYYGFQRARMEIAEYDLAEEEEQGIFSLSFYFPIMYFFFISIVNAIVVMLVLELFPGEKEKGVFDLILLSGVSLQRLMIGKITAIMLSVFFSLLLGCTASVIGCGIFDHRLLSRFGKSVVRWENLTALCFLLFGFALLMVAIQVFIASFFRTKEGASAYSTLGMLIVSGVSMLQVRGNASGVKYLPIANFIDSMQDMLNNQVEWGAVVCSTVLAMILAGLLIFQASKQWGKERE